MFEYLWLACMATVAAILFKVFLKKKRAGQIAVESAAPPSTLPPASETAASSGHDYEVFLSFRGSDTRSGFTDFLYTSLDRAGIRTFKDDKKLPVGEEFPSELLQAIDQSKISIPIFSKNYASSVWCLKEVARMVERQKTGRQKIMPIFYDVAPSEVRHQTEGYGKAFRSHEKKGRYDKKDICQWKAALTAVGAINGWDLHRIGEERREGEFAKELTEEVFKELKKAYLEVSDHLVSVDNHVDAIMEMMGAQTSETRIIGIHGMGGIGKTTIAKLIYNKLLPDFEYRCFLGDIRETSKVKGIQFLQEQLIRDTLKIERTNIGNSCDGIRIIKERLYDKRVLLLLDDVDHRDHMNALAGNHGWFGKGSKLIITTRNKEVLNVLKEDNLYEVSLMDSYQSLQLFSKHAFRRDSPLDDYINQSKRAVEIAGGLPLALEVIGSLLCRTEKEMWDDTLKMLESVPNNDVQSKLKISYDALDCRQKLIFLDIACLFIGYDKDILVHFWDESNFFPKVAMDVLQNMSLIKINEHNKVWMHDQLRDLGREMVREKSGMQMEKQSRVWDPKEGLDLLTGHKGCKEVQALRLKLDHERLRRFTYEGFESLSMLRFLEVDCREESFRAEDKLLWHETPSNGLEESVLVPQLRWLSWRNIPPTFNIANFSMENVVILNLSGSTITHDWKGWSHMRTLKRLKVLDLSSCARLESLPNDLGRGLVSLEYLYLKWCKSLESLPNSIGELTSLIELDISGTRIEELPRSIGELRNLKVVKMPCTRISKIPDAFWNIGKLEQVEASGRFNRLHGNIGRGIGENKSLSILKLGGADIYKLPPLPESLTILHLDELRMETFPDISNLTDLKELDLTFALSGDGGKLNGLGEEWIPRWIVDLTKLESLSLNSHYVATVVSTDLSLPPHLKYLHLSCPNLGRLPRLPSSLSSLSLEQCESLRLMEDLSNLKNLSSLSLTQCYSLHSMDLSGLNKLSSLKIIYSGIAEIQGLGCLENLRELVLLGLKQLKVLPDLRNSNKLRSLDVEHCGFLVVIEGEVPLSLDELSIHTCRSLVEVPDLSSLKKLQKFNVAHWWNEPIPDSARRSRVNLWEKLRNLQICGLGQVEILPDLSNLNELRSLYVDHCANLVEIQGELPQSLEELEISDCQSLLKLPDLSSLKELQKVGIAHCRKSKREAILGSARRSQVNLWENINSCIYRNKSLRILNLRWMDIYALLRLPESLIKLQLSELYMDTFPDLSNLANLKELDLEFHSRDSDGESDGLVEYPIPQWIGNLSKLESLVLRCHFVTTSLTDLSLPPHLKALHLKCPNLRCLPRLPSRLSSLHLECCLSLCLMEDLSNLKKLSFLEIWQGAIIEIPGLGCLENLRDLMLCGLGQVERLPDLSSLNKLRSLQVRCCDNLVEIQGELPESLGTLVIQSCRSLRKLPNTSSLMDKQVLEISNCNALNVEAILECARKNPRDLQIVGFDQLQILSDLSNLGKSNELRRLQVAYCGNLVEIRGKLPESLEILEIDTCESLRKLPDLSRLMELREVCIGECGSLIEIQCELPKSLEKLEIYFCKSLQKLPDLSSLMGLREVCIGECGNLVEIQGELPESLEELKISFCESLQKLPNMSSLMGLREFCVGECGSLVEIQGELPQSLENLEIRSCKSLQKLPDLSGLLGLREVCIEKCGNLVEIQGELPQSLEELKISFCKSLQKLPNLSSLKELRRVEIDRCRKLNMEAISSLCLEKSVEFVGEDAKSESEQEGEDEESESEGEDAKPETEYEGEDEE